MPIFAASASNTSMNVAPMILRFRSGSVTPARRSRNSRGGVDEHERQLQPFEAAADLVGLVETHDAVVDEDARQAIADGAMDEQRGDRRIHAAAQPAHHAPVADLLADPRGRLLDKRRHRPVAGAAADVVGEIPEDVEPAIGVHDFGVEQERVESLRRGCHRRHRRVGARRRHGEARRRRRDEIAMAGPDAQLCGDRSRRAARPARSGSSPDRTRDAAPARPHRPSGPSSTACRSRSRGPARRFRARRARSAALPARRRSSDRPRG